MKNLKIFMFFSLSQFVILNNLLAFNPAHLALALSDEQNLRGLDLSGPGLDLSWRTFENKDFSGTDFRYANLSHTLFYNCTLNGTIFIRANLERATIQLCVGTGTTFRSARAPYLSVVNCTFRVRCCFSRARLVNATFMLVSFLGDLFLNRANVLNCAFTTCGFQNNQIFGNRTRNLHTATLPFGLTIIETPQQLQEEGEDEDDEPMAIAEVEMDEIEVDEKTATNPSDVCPICREPFGEKMVYSLSCKHEFCPECITEWLARARTCPYCARRL